jgi:hypothetical protein
MSKLHSLVRDITRVRAIKLHQAAAEANGSQALPLRENHILASFTPNTVMTRPWARLPNCKKMLIETNKADALLLQFDVSKKLDPKLTFINLSWKIKASNRYLRIMEYRLESLLRKQDSFGFWILALLLMEKSRVLHTLALRKLNINWFREYSFPMVQKLLSMLKEKITTMDKSSFIIRTYADKVKPDGSITYRPVGSPAYVDRMFLYLWQCFFVMFFTTYISKSQHAYRPKAGVMTATKELGETLKDSKWKHIWEFDLKGAFPSTHIPNTCFELTRRGLPHHISSFIEGLSLSTIERVDLSIQGRMLPEPKFDTQVAFGNLRSTFPQGENLGQGPSMVGKLTLGLLSTSTENAEGVGERLRRLFSKPDLNILRPVNGKNELTAQLEAQDLKQLKTSSILVKGFPQGTGLSPILFNFAFETMIKRVHFDNKKYLTNGLVKLISYADDFIFFSTHWLPTEMLMTMPFKPTVHSPWTGPAQWEGLHNEIALLNQIETRDLGLRFSKEKSHKLMEDGVWLREKFKFLGQTIHLPTKESGRTDFIFEGTPRSGAKLAMTDDKHLMVSKHTQRDTILKGLKFNLISPAWHLDPQEILNRWGRNEWPWNLLPSTVTVEALPLTDSEAILINERTEAESKTVEKSIIDKTIFHQDPNLDKIVRQNLLLGLYPTNGMDREESLFYDKDWAELLIAGWTPEEIDKAKSCKTAEEFKQLVKETSRPISKSEIKGFYDKGTGPTMKSFNFMEGLKPKLKPGALDFVKSRLLGTLQSRLFSGSWDLADFVVDRTQKSVNPRSWLNMREGALFRGPLHPSWFVEYPNNKSLFSCSSYAGLDILNMLKHPKSIKWTGSEKIGYILKYQPTDAKLLAKLPR